MDGQRIPHFRDLPWKAVAPWVLSALMVSQCTGCATPESRYKTLSFFFDGVPEPGQEVVVETTNSVVETRPEEPTFYVHQPYAERRCDLCHEGGFSNRLRTVKTKLCGLCHSGEEFEGSVKHGPAVSGQCYGCHDPHKSRYEHLLLDSGSAICGQCHTLETYPGLDKHRAEQGDECLACHSPHSSDKDGLLR